MVKSGETGINRLLARLRAVFNWAIGEGYVGRTPFKREGVTVVKLEGKAEKRRRRRLLPGEEQGMIAHAGPHLQALIIAALETGCRIGELLSLQWKEIEQTIGPSGEPVSRCIGLKLRSSCSDPLCRKIPTRTPNVTIRRAPILKLANSQK
jgi:hypothetical protein